MSGTILVADDSPTMQRRASGILEGEGLEVVTVANGVAAIKKLATIKPLLVLADVSMPGRDGYEVCQIIKQSPDTRHVPVLLIFSDVDPYDQARGAQVGADGSVKKPFVDEELLGMVKRITEQVQPAAAPPPVAVRPPQPPAPVFEDFENEAAPLPETEPGFSSVPEGIAFASDIPAIAPETTLPQSESFRPQPPELEAPAEADEPAVETFEAHAFESEHGGPVLVEEPISRFEETHEHPHPHEHESIFHSPEEIAEPVLADEVETPPASLEPPSSEPAEAASPAEFEAALHPTAEAEGETHIAEEPPAIHEAHALPEASLPEATAPAAEEVFGTEPESFSPPQGETPSHSAEPETAAEAVPSAIEEGDRLESDAAPLGREQIYRIVREVVVKMSPLALPSSTIEELTQRFTEEILASIHD